MTYRRRDPNITTVTLRGETPRGVDKSLTYPLRRTAEDGRLFLYTRTGLAVFDPATGVLRGKRRILVHAHVESV